MGCDGCARATWMRAYDRGSWIVARERRRDGWMDEEGAARKRKDAAANKDETRWTDDSIVDAVMSICRSY
jgi:hypothetical protein